MARNMAQMWGKGLSDAFESVENFNSQAIANGMSDSLFMMIGLAVTALKKKYPDIDFGLDGLLDSWKKQKDEFISSYGQNRLDLLDSIGMNNSNVLGAIDSGLSKLSTKDRAAFWRKLYAMDELPKTGDEMISLVQSIFASLGLTVSENAAKVDGIWKKGMEEIVSAAEKYSDAKLSNTNYTSIFERMLGADGNGRFSIGTSIYDYAKEALSAYTQDAEEYQKYAENIMKNMIGDNGWLSYLLDNDGMIKSIEDVDDVINQMDADGVFKEMNISADDLRLAIEGIGDEANIAAEMIRLMFNASNENSAMSMAAANRKAQERNAEARTGYKGTIGSLESVFNADGAQKTLEAFNALDSEIRSGLNESYPELTAVLGAYEEKALTATEANEALANVFTDMNNKAGVSFFKDTEEAMKGIEDGTGDITEAVSKYSDEFDKLREVQSAFNKVEEVG